MQLGAPTGVSHSMGELTRDHTKKNPRSSSRRILAANQRAARTSGHPLGSHRGVLYLSMSTTDQPPEKIIRPGGPTPLRNLAAHEATRRSMSHATTKAPSGGDSFPRRHGAPRPTRASTSATSARCGESPPAKFMRRQQKFQRRADDSWYARPSQLPTPLPSVAAPSPPIPPTAPAEANPCPPSETEGPPRR